MHSSVDKRYNIRYTTPPVQADPLMDVDDVLAPKGDSPVAANDTTSALFLMTGKTPNTTTTTLPTLKPPKTMSLQMTLLMNHLPLLLLLLPSHQLHIFHVSFRPVIFTTRALAPVTLTTFQSLPLLHTSHARPISRKKCYSGCDWPTCIPAFVGYMIL